MEEQELIPLALDDRFNFSCSPDVPCFNECCRDLNQFLTPYDILRLKKHLNLTSTEFLDQYTVQHIGPETGLPVIVLKQDADSDNKCPFVSENGCLVYENRPSSCRAYPLARLLSRNRETGELIEQYAIVKEDHCRGFEQEKSQTVQEWIDSQDLETCNEMNDLLMALIVLKNQNHPEPLDFRERHLFHLACYDLDNFRKQVFENNLLKDEEIPPEALEAARNDDVVLLKLGLEWVKKSLFYGK